MTWVDYVTLFGAAWMAVGLLLLVPVCFLMSKIDREEDNR